MSKCIIIDGKNATHFECSDCKPVRGAKTFRTRGRFCDPLCRMYVINMKYGHVENLPPEPGDEFEALKMRVELLEKQVLKMELDFEKVLSHNRL